jgi:hypothetical protein
VLVGLLAGCPPREETDTPTDVGAAPPPERVDPSTWVPPPSVDAPPTADPDATPTLTWKQQMAVDIDSFKRDDALRYMKVRTAFPDEDNPEDPEFIALLSGDPRSAGVIIQRLLSASEPPEIRAILAAQLPYTRGRWQEGAAVLIRLDPDAAVRKALVETMRYSEPPHALVGLQSGLEDEDPAVRSAAARTAGFLPAATLLEADLLEVLQSDPDWETRAAVAQSLGALKIESALPGLVAALDDRDRRVRLAALLALERIDVVAAAQLDEVQALARTTGSLATTARRILKRGRAGAEG